MNSVDLALVLAVDGSASVTYEEFGLIAGGMAGALREPPIVAALIGGPANAFADQVDNMPRVVSAGETAIGEALLASLTLLSHIPDTPTRQVVNVIGDGRSNSGLAPGPVRDRMVEADITINGLCILHEEPDLLESYTRDVIGGPGAFAVTCQDYPAFAAAMKQKLARELNVPIA